jgi:hypothetical protein
VRYFPVLLGKKEKVRSKQLEPDAVPEPALSRPGFVINFSEFLSKTRKFSFPKGEKRKANWCGHAVVMVLTTRAGA